MKAICSKDKNHDRFSTVAHVTQDWIVDENGDFLEVANDCIQITYGPDN